MAKLVFIFMYLKILSANTVNILYLLNLTLSDNKDKRKDKQKYNQADLVISFWFKIKYDLKIMSKTPCYNWKDKFCAL